MKQWREFFGSDDLPPLETIERRHPNARRHMRGCVFVSHAGADVPTIDALFTKPMRAKYSPYAVFQYNSTKPRDLRYKDLVLLAMTYCKCAVVVCSRHSAQHAWVYAEVDWLLVHCSRIFLLCLDETSPTEIHPQLGWMGRMRHGIRTFRPGQASQLRRRVERLGIPSAPGFDWT